MTFDYKKLVNEIHLMLAVRPDCAQNRGISGDLDQGGHNFRVVAWPAASGSLGGADPSGLLTR